MMIITARTTKFPDNLEAAQLLAENIASQIREQAAAYNSSEVSTVRLPAMAKLHELEKRQAALNYHIGQLIEAEQLERQAAARQARRPKRRLPELLALPKKSKALLQAERDIEAAADKVGKAHDALRVFAATEHSDSFKAGKESIQLQGAHSAASREHTAAGIKLATERGAWHAACSASLEAAWKEREADAHALLDQIEDALAPLRSRTFGMMNKLRALRKAMR